MHIDEELFKKDSFKKNLKLYEETVKSGSQVFMDIDDMTDIIDYYNYDGRVDDAMRVADYALSMYPGAIGPLVFKARQAIQEGNMEEAGNFCESIYDKSDMDYFYLKVELLIAANKCDESEAMLEEALATIEPEEKENFYFDNGALYIDYGYPDLAEKWLNLTEDKENVDWMELMSRIHSLRNEANKAATLIEALIDKNPFVCRYWNMLAMIHLSNNNFDESLSCSEYSLAINPTNTDGLWCKAKSLMYKGEIDRAIEYYDRFMEIIPDNARAEADKGACLLQNRDFNGALKLLRLAKQHNIDDDLLLVQIYDDMAFAYSGLKEIEKAMCYLEKSESVSKNNDDIETNDILRLVMRAHIWLQNSQVENARRMFDKAISLSGEDPELIFRIIISTFELDFYEMSIDYFRRLEKIMPKDWDKGYSYMAVSLIRTSQFKEGVKYLKKACKLNCDEAESVLGDMFPSSISKEHYYEFVKDIDI